MQSPNTFESFANDSRLFELASQGSAEQFRSIAADAVLLLDRMSSIPVSDRLRLYYETRQSLLATVRNAGDAAQQLEVAS